MTLNAELQQYLTENFKGLQLTQPLFYQNIPGLRFDLQDEELSIGNKYFAEVSRRVNFIFNEITDENDELLLFLHCYPWKKKKIRKNGYVFRQLIDPPPPYQFKKSNNPLYNDIYLVGKKKACQLIVKGKVGNINFKNIFSTIAHNDFPQKTFNGEVYIINTSTNTIMLMYDDRGCDVISNDIPLLRRYYNKLSDLILEYDRKQIIQTLSI